MSLGAAGEARRVQPCPEQGRRDEAVGFHQPAAEDLLPGAASGGKAAQNYE